MNDIYVEHGPAEEDFNEIVHWDDDRVENFVSTELIGQLLNTTYVKGFIFGLIVVNAALIGLQTDEQMVGTIICFPFVLRDVHGTG